jgi:ribonuclease HII
MNIYVDEVGRGSIAGDVVVCALALPNGTLKLNDSIKDSKKLSKKKREEIFDLLSDDLVYDFGILSPQKIEELNIFHATYKAMKIAVLKLVNRGVKVDKIFIDGPFTIPGLDFPQEAIVKGDDKLWEIGAASIFAKVKRDRMMSELDKDNLYDWNTNAGYYAPKHHAGIVLFGPSNIHRAGFKMFQMAMEDRKNFLDSGLEQQEFLDMIFYKKKTLADYIKWEHNDFKGWV